MGVTPGVGDNEVSVSIAEGAGLGHVGVAPGVGAEAPGLGAPGSGLGEPVASGAGVGDADARARASRWATHSAAFCRNSTAWPPKARCRQAKPMACGPAWA